MRLGRVSLRSLNISGGTREGTGRKDSLLTAGVSLARGTGHRAGDGKGCQGTRRVMPRHREASRGGWKEPAAEAERSEEDGMARTGRALTPPSGSLLTS